MQKSKVGISLFLALILLFGMAMQAGATPPDHAMRHVPDHVKEKFQNRVEASLEFRDLDEAAWAIPFINRMRALNVLSGYDDGTFRPNQPVSRVEAMVTAVRLMGLEEEAEAKPEDAELHFRDADLIDRRYPWAEGYLLVALEQGLFDTSETHFQPGKPASRVWVASLMVKALGLEDEALERMTEIPDFKDADAIPAGAIGYVNVAVDEGIIKGYDDETFRPNRNVTRAEMAVLLNQTGNRIWDEEALWYVGEITDIDFEGHEDEEREGTVTVDVYRDNTGDLDDTLTFEISSELYVSYKNRYFAADQLIPGDLVELVVLDGEVMAATLLDEDEANEDTAVVRELIVKLEQDDDEYYKLYYKSGRGTDEARIERKEDGETNRLEGEAARELIETFLENLDLHPDLDKETVRDRVMDVLHLEDYDYEELLIKVRYSNGDKVKIEAERDDDAARDEDEDDDEEEENRNDEDEDDRLKMFKVELKLEDGGEFKAEYKQHDEHSEFKVEIKRENEKAEWKGEAAEDWLEDNGIRLPDERGEIDREEMLSLLLNALDVDEDDVEKIEMKAEFENGAEWKYEA